MSLQVGFNLIVINHRNITMFKSERYFRLWGYSPSFETLIIRSEKQEVDVLYPTKYIPNNTIDIEFSGVSFISLPNEFREGLNIVKKGNKYFFNENQYVEATFCQIGISQWDESKDRITDFSNTYEQVILQF